MFTFQNGDGSKEDASGGHINEGFCCRGVYSEIKLQTNFSPVPSNTDSLSNDEAKVSNDIADDDVILDDGDNSKENIVCSNVNYVNGLNCSLNSSYDAISTHDMSDENDDLDVDEKSISDTNTNDYMNDTNECGVDGDQTQENCISHDVNGVLLHHKGLKKTFTLAIAALQVAEVWINIVPPSLFLFGRGWYNFKEDGSISIKFDIKENEFCLRDNFCGPCGFILA